MAIDKKKDDLLFNCTQKHEFSYVSGQYGENENSVLDFLKNSCKDGTIKNSTHGEVYRLIKNELGLDRA